LVNAWGAVSWIKRTEELKKIKNKNKNALKDVLAKQTITSLSYWDTIKITFIPQIKTKEIQPQYTLKST
jgi:hypothetical protein